MSTNTPTLEERVAALEQEVTTLGADTLQPNVLTVGPGGLIGAQFSGKIAASELDLIGGAGASPIKWITVGGALLAELTVDASGNLTLSPSGTLNAQGMALPAGLTGDIVEPGVDSVTWKRTSDGVLIAFVSGSSSGTVAEAQLGAIADSPVDSSRAQIVAYDDLQAIRGEIFVTQTGRVGGQATVSFPGLATRVLLNGAGQSQFLQLVSTQKLQLQAGTTTITLNAGADTNFPLPTAWTNQHLAFIASITPGPAAPPNYGSRPNGLANGDIWSNAGGNWNISWLSLGN